MLSILLSIIPLINVLKNRFNKKKTISYFSVKKHINMKKWFILNLFRRSLMTALGVIDVYPPLCL